MHIEARAYVESVIDRFSLKGLRTLEIGGRDINGSIRDLFQTTDYTSIDIAPGAGVDVVADAASLPFAPQTFDVVVCCEVFEHTPAWPKIIAGSRTILREGGYWVMTAACDPRKPHSGFDGGSVREGEYYGNVPLDRLPPVVQDSGLCIQSIQVHGRGDVYVTAVATAR